MAGENMDADQELRLKLYADARSDLLKRQLSNSENADRAILSVSTAALGFSLAFLKDIVPLSEACFAFMPYLSWGLFTLAIMVTLASFFTSQKAIDEQLELAHRYYVERDDYAVSIKPKQARVTDILNRSGAILLALGLVITCVFVGINLLKGKAMSNKKQINEGASVPLMQRIPQGGAMLQKGASIPSLQAVPTNPQGGAPVPSLQHVPVAPASAPTPTEGSKGK
jgi:hypothetical protein